MLVSYIDIQGNAHQIELSEGELLAAAKTGDPVAYFNRKHADADPKFGSAFDQFKLSAGLIRADKPNPMGLRSASIGAVMNGTAGIQAAGAGNVQNTLQTASRAFVNISLVDEVLAEMSRDRTTDTVVFDEMVSNTLTITTEHFEQPVVDYRTTGGPEQAMASRVAQGALPPKMLFFKTSDRIRRIGSYTIGMEWSDQALANTTIDYVARTTSHYLQV